MTKYSKMNTCLLVVVCLVYFTPTVIAQTFGDRCIGASLCNKTNNLICGPSQRCICTDGAVTSTLKYELLWNIGEQKCLGKSGSACLEPSIECAPGLTCVPEKSLPGGLGSCKVVQATKILTYGEPCNMGTYCNKASGLICGEDNTCACTNGTINRDLKFTFEWNLEQSKCLASLNSACIGTRQNPDVVVTRVECAGDATCEELADLKLPFGVGVCKNPNEVEEPTTTLAPGNPTENTPPGSSTPVDGGDNGVSQSGRTNALAIAVFTVFTLIVTQ